MRLPILVAVTSSFAIAVACSSDGQETSSSPTQDAGSVAPDGGDVTQQDAGGGDATSPDGGSGVFSPRSQANILFSGHSLLDEPIPQWVEAIAVAKGDTLGWEQQNIPGSPIRVRTRGDSGWGGYQSGKNRSGSNRDLLAELANPTTIASGQRYDTLLITERHDPLETVRWENTVGFLRHYHDRVAEHESGARTLLYQVWPDIDKNAPAAWITYETTELLLWECIAGKVNLSLEADSRAKNVVVVPGSQALARLVEAALDDQVAGIDGTQRQKLDAIFSDNVHLTAIGRYFIAALHYGATFGKTPEGANAVSEVPAATAAALESLAWTSLTSYAASGAPTGRPMEECRARVASEVCPAFYTIRNIASQSCTLWSDADGPLRFPDPDLPLPAP